MFLLFRCVLMAFLPSCLILNVTLHVELIAVVLSAFFFLAVCIHFCLFVLKWMLLVSLFHFQCYFCPQFLNVRFLKFQAPSYHILIPYFHLRTHKRQKLAGIT